MSELYGVQAGQRLAQQDAQQRQLQQLAVQQGNQQLESGQLAQEEQRQKLEAGKLAVDQQKQYLEQLSQLSKKGSTQSAPGTAQTEQTDDMAGQLEKFAQVAAAVGQTDKAKEYLSTASTIRKNSSEISSRTIDDNMKMAKIGAAVLQTVRDAPEEQKQEAWARANAMFELQTGRPSKFGKFPYSPELVDALSQEIIGAVDKAKIAASKSTEKANEALVKTREAQLPLIASQTKVADARAIALARAGVKEDPNAVKAMSDKIIADYGTAVSKEQARTAGREMITRADQLVSQGNMDRATAVEKAYQEQKANGVLKGVQPGAIPGREDAITQIDDLISQLKKDPSLAGIKGQLRRGKENVRTNLPGYLGGSNEAPANAFDSRVESLLLQLPKLITGTSKSAKDERARVERLVKNTADLFVGKLDIGSGKIMADKLVELKSILRKQTSVGGTPALGSTNSKGWILNRDKESGDMAWVSPDGKSFEEFNPEEDSASVDEEE